MARQIAGTLAVPILALLSTTAAPQPTPIRGHVKGQWQYLSAPAGSLADALDQRTSAATNIDFRVGGSWTAGRLRFDADYLLLGITGSAVEYQKQLEALEPDLFIDRAETQWLPLDDTISDDDRSRVTQSLDRFSVSYTTDQWVFRLGRQAYTWGNGIVFRPFDIFDPFPPDVLDDSYKLGVDALYTQRLFADGSDLIALIVPRRDPATGRLERSASSAALKWHQFGEHVQTDWMLARDYLTTVAGFGIAGALGQAVWRMSIVPTWLEKGGTRTSLVVNFEHAWQWRAHNVSAFAEYFRNGFGRTDRAYALDELDPELISRLARGQTFNTGRDYLAGGLRIALTPLFEIDPSLLVNLNDRSALALVRGNYSIVQNLSLDFGLQAGMGPVGTEFGGLPTSTDSQTFAAPPTRVYARISFYF